MDHVRFDVREPDLRPAVVLDHVVDAVASGLSAQGNPLAESLWRITRWGVRVRTAQVRRRFGGSR